jgi:hypothetical protein
MRFKLALATLRYLIWGSIAATLLLVSTEAFGEAQRAVSLLYFRGTGLEKAVSLEWATASELDTAGYRLERANAAEGPFQNLGQIGIVPARGDSLQGADYYATDRDSVQNGTKYWYRLIEIEFNGTENPVGPISVTAGRQEPTATSVPGSTAQATATTLGGSMATATPTSSSTPTDNATASGSSLTATLLATASGSVSNAARGASTTPTARAQAVAVLAQAGTLAPGTAYPGAPGATLPPPLGTPVANQAYPSPAFEATALQTAPYPLSVEGKGRGITAGQPAAIPTGTLAALIGESPGGAAASATDSEPEAQRASSSTVLLWAGFLAALMIFILAVVGSIIYFRR